MRFRLFHFHACEQVSNISSNLHVYSLRTMIVAGHNSGSDGMYLKHTALFNNIDLRYVQYVLGTAVLRVVMTTRVT